MNLVNELENELVVALLVEKKHPREINNERALALIDKIKFALESNSANKREKDINVSPEKRLSFFSN